MHKFEKLLKEYRNRFACILPFDFKKKTVFKLDLSVNNSALINIKALIGKEIGVIFPEFHQKKTQTNGLRFVLTLF